MMEDGRKPSQADAPASTEIGADGRAKLARPGDEAPPGEPSAAEAICPDCSGSGRRSGRPCPTCRGTGRVTEGVGGG